MAGNIANISTGTLIKDLAASRHHSLAVGQSSDSIHSMLYGDSGSHCMISIGALHDLCALQGPPAGFEGHIFNFLLYVLYPISSILSMVVMAIGIILISFAIYRIREHSTGNASRQKSYISTTFYFIAGAILVQYGPVVHMLSVSTFYGFYSPNVYEGNVLDYVHNLPDPSNATPGLLMQQLTFALLLVVGMFSFLRGVFLLIKLGEGGGQESVLSKSIAHILAGVIGINAAAAWHLMSYMSGVLTGS